MQNNAINNIYSFRILEQFGITSITYENVFQGNHLDLECRFHRHILFPYIQVSTSRKCLGTCMNIDAPYVNETCDGTCDKKSYVLYNEQIKQEVKLVGNTIIYKNEELPKDLNRYSRIIINEQVSDYDDIKYFDDLLLRNG